MILTGVPPFGPTSWSAEGAESTPAGCGPTAALMLLAYYDSRFGYARLVRSAPEQAIVELHDRMNTLTIAWGGARQGFTDPFSFFGGLEVYVNARYPRGVRLESKLGTLEDVFSTSVALIKASKPHIILFDWRGETLLFPNHYAVVVGFRAEAGRKDLIINPGWGYDFQILDMTDPAVAPAILFWIESWTVPPDGQPSGSIGPASVGSTWVLDKRGGWALQPVLRQHFAPSHVEVWRPSDSVDFLVADEAVRIAACAWY